MARDQANPTQGTVRPAKLKCIAPLLVLILLVGSIAVAVWPGRDDAKGPTPDNAPGAAARDEPEPAGAALTVTMDHPQARQARVVAWRERAVRVADNVSAGVFRFTPPPPADSLIVGWTTRDGPSLAGAVGYAAYTGGDDAMVLHAEPVWTLRVAVRGTSPGEQTLRVGLQFPGAADAARWSHLVELIGGKPAGFYLRRPSGANQFDLPMLPADVPLRVSAECDGMFAESEEVRLSDDAELELTLSRVLSERQVRVRDSLGAPADAKLAIDVRPAQDDDAGRIHTVTRTGPSGNAEIPGDLNSTAYVSVVDDDWVSDRNRHVLLPGGRTMDIPVWRAATLRLTVEYDDGQPYYGPVRVFANLDDDELEPSNRRSVFFARLVDASTPIVRPTNEIERAMYGDSSLFHGVAEFYKVPVGPDLKVNIPHERVGYPMYESTLPPDATEPGVVTKIVVPAKITAKSLSRIRIVGVDKPSPDLHVVVYRLIGQEVAPFCRFALAETNESWSMHPGRYLVRITGANAWQAEVELPPGVTHDVFPRFEQGAVVKARILNERGEPMAGATLDIASRGAPRFPAEAVFGVLAVANADGVVELRGQPAGTAVFRLEAFGYQPAHVNATVHAGGKVELGDVKLSRAVGEIRIRLPESREGTVLLKADLVVPWGTGQLMFEVESGNMIIFAGVAVDRTYSVAVIPEGGGSSLTIFNEVRPTAAEPIVILDATDIEVPKESK
ncbi:MAG: carboxypeptidase regulatory-like domain-containing protein [Planctomycetes bacterium]|nr:carboxypeptidase regulatory-like domain-containing protein [Planctomycetota bacterium]MCW8136674.1 carboxypeptidase regulatory-like domain-containing protein [Planctomycetota bacterium]